MRYRKVYKGGEKEWVIYDNRNKGEVRNCGDRRSDGEQGKGINYGEKIIAPKRFLVQLCRKKGCTFQHSPPAIKSYSRTDFITSATPVISLLLQGISRVSALRMSGLSL